MHLYEIPLPQNLENEFLFQKYIKPYIWEGTLLIDNGWGPKDSVLDLTSDDPITGFKVPFYVAPQNTVDYTTGRDQDRHYTVAFPGEQWQLLYNFINAVRELGVEEQKYVLNSYFSTQIPEEGAEIFQLCITATPNKTTISIEKGKWIPSFDDNLIIAGW